jgi:prolyl-tRNA editing enzyme YbaK/EbsC (Cys-tRNA(Pro) deacylase)
LGDVSTENQSPGGRGLSASAARVMAELRRLGTAGEVRELPDSTRTARDAAAALRCEPAQIVKSLVFRDLDRDRPVLVLICGVDRVDESKLADLVGAAVGQAPAAFVRDRTGYAIGGVPPVGHREAIETYVDEGVMAHEQLWAAAGTPRAVFPTTGDELLRLTGGRLGALAEG